MKHILRDSLFLMATLAVVFFTGCKSKDADLLLVNGIVYTADAPGTVAQAIAIKDGKIVAVGRTNDLKFEYNADSVVDLRGAFVYPGFIDAHCHYYGYAMNLNRVNLVGTTSWEEAVTLVDSFAIHQPEGWILGRGWDQNDWKDQEWPSKSLLDKRYPDRPVLLRRVDGHAAIANQAALDAAGIDRKTKVQGGKILMRGRKPSGILIDHAVDLVESAIPASSKKDVIAALKEAEANLFRVGLTTVDDAGLDLEIINLIDSLQQSGDLKIRVYAMANPSEENFARFSESGPYKTDRMHVRSFKVYADGSLGSRGACLLSSYKDAPGQKGFLLQDVVYYREVAERIHAAGMQMNTHCIGDSANRLILDIYSEVLDENNDDRWRVEHSQIVSPVDFDKFKRYNIWPSVQPTHATSDMYWAEDRIGKDRIKGAYAYKTLYSQNNKIAFGSDFPVEDINPILGFYSAVARVDLENFPYGGFMLEEAVGRDTAFRAMTILPAEANFEEKEKGSIEVGKFADFVITNQDLLYTEQDQLPYIQVVQTFVNGEVVYNSEF